MASLSVLIGLPSESVALISLALSPKGRALSVWRTLLVSLACTFPAEDEEPKALAGMVNLTPAIVSSKVPPLAGVMGLDRGGSSVTGVTNKIFLPVTEPAVTSTGLALEAASA